MEKRYGVGLADLHPLINADIEQDFFHQLFNIKLKQRQRCLKTLKSQLDAGGFKNYLKTFEKVLLPLIDYIVLAGQEQMQNKRNTISYDKEHKRELLDVALEIYEAYARQLDWPEYFKFVKIYLYKLQRAETKINKTKMNAGQADPELQKEKVTTKVICKILNGFHFSEVPDAIDTLIKEKGLERDGGKKGT